MFKSWGNPVRPVKSLLRSSAALDHWRNAASLRASQSSRLFSIGLIGVATRAHR